MSHKKAVSRYNKQFSGTCNHLNYKVVLLGDYGVGKSTLFQWLRDGEPPQAYSSLGTNCIGMDKCSRPFTLENGQTVQMEFWDTAGSERYHSLTKNYYHMCSAVVLVYDASEPTTLSSLKDWIEDAKRYAPSNVTFMLLANKYDIQDSAATNTSVLGEAFAEMHSIPLYFKISAKEGDKNLLTELFQRLAEFIHSKEYAQRKVSGRVEQLQMLPEETVSLSLDHHQLLENSCYDNGGRYNKRSNCSSCSKR